MITSQPQWKRQYKNKNNGRRHFQIDLAYLLGDLAIKWDWTGDLGDDSGKPAWMRQRGLIPCGCNKCFFCTTGRTNGLSHRRVSAPPVPSPRNQVPAQCSVLPVNIRHCTQNCAVCYKIVSGCYSGNLTGAERTKLLRQQCSQTRKGCSTCNIVVCDFHYHNGDFSHNRGDYPHVHLY